MIAVKRRVMVIPKIEKYIGTQDDAYAEFRVFRVDRYTDNQADLSVHTFKLVTTDEDGRDNIINLEKAVQDEYIDLTWTIMGQDVKKSGTILAQIQAFDVSNVVRWNSYIGSFYIKENLEVELNDDQINDYRYLSTRVSTQLEEIENLRQYIDLIQNSSDRLDEALNGLNAINNYVLIAEDRVDAIQNIAMASETRSGLLSKDNFVSINSINTNFSEEEWEDIMG